MVCSQKVEIFGVKPGGKHGNQGLEGLMKSVVLWREKLEQKFNFASCSCRYLGFVYI